MTKNILEFSSRVFKIDINPCVDVLEDTVQVLLRAAKKDHGPIPVKGRLKGQPFRTTVVKYRGAWRLYLNTYMRTDAGVDVGDLVNVTLELDTKSRIVPIPTEFAQALARNKKAKDAFARLTPSHRREILLYLNWLKTPESMKRNIDKVMSFLLNKKRS